MENAVLTEESLIEMVKPGNNFSGTDILRASGLYDSEPSKPKQEQYGEDTMDFSTRIKLRKELRKDSGSSGQFTLNQLVDYCKQLGIPVDKELDHHYPNYARMSLLMKLRRRLDLKPNSVQQSQVPIEKLIQVADILGLKVTHKNRDKLVKELKCLIK